MNVLKNYTPQLPPVLGSTTRLQQVFLNLFLNARDAMPGGGMLEVRTAAHNGSVEVEVTDTGMRHRAGASAPHFRSFLHHQSHRQGHRPGPFGELRHY